MDLRPGWPGKAEKIQVVYPAVFFFFFTKISIVEDLWNVSMVNKYIYIYDIYIYIYIILCIHLFFLCYLICFDLLNPWWATFQWATFSQKSYRWPIYSWLTYQKNGGSFHTHRIHGAAIYGNMDPIPMLAYIPAPWISWILWVWQFTAG